MVQKREGGEKKDLRNKKIKLKATDAHPYLPEGKVFEVHPVHKETLLERQWAVEENEKNTKASNPVGLKETDNMIQTSNDEGKENKSRGGKKKADDPVDPNAQP